MFGSTPNQGQGQLFRNAMPRRVPGIRRILAVASGKGGVGKSTVAVNLSLGLVHLGYRVGLLDADVHGPNVPLMLGVRRRAEALGWEAILPLASRDVRNTSAERIPALDRYGLKVMSVGLLVGDDQAVVDSSAFVGRLVCNLMQMVEWGDLDVLLVDLPPGTGEPQSSLISTIVLDGAAIVVTPQDLALLDSTRALHAFQAGGVPVLGVIENMSYLNCPTCGERIQVFHRSQTPRAISSGAIPLLAEIPIEPAISEAADTGRPLLVTDPNGTQARIFLDLSTAIAERLALDSDQG
jgi:ATP-binding protein involved in chromosome partitioning